MAKYEITIQQTLQRTVIVDAGSSDEALRKADDAVIDGMIVLDGSTDVRQYRISPSERWTDGKVPEGTDMGMFQQI